MIHYTDSTMMPFGKYKGLRLIEVPASYLIYLYEDAPTPLQHEALKQYIKDNLDVLRTQKAYDTSNRNFNPHYKNEN